MRWGPVAAAVIALLLASQVDVRGPSAGPAADIAVKVQLDGTLSVTEKVTVPAGQRLIRHIPLRIPAGTAQDRVYTIRDVKAAGAGTAELTGNQLVVSLRGGESALTYTVDGAVAELSGGQQVRWQLADGWDTELARITASVTAPVREMSSVECFAGPIGSSRQCTLSEIDDTGIVRVEQDGLKVGDRVDLAIQLPPGTVPANARFEQANGVADAFAFGPLAGIGFIVLALFPLLGGFVGGGCACATCAR
jgi:hypothetical protein